MTVGQQIVETLRAQKESKKQLTFEFVRDRSSMPYAVTIESEGASLQALVEDFDRFGLLFRHLRVTLGNTGEYEPTDVAAFLIDAIREGMSCLEGGLDCVESDTTTGCALLRSRPARGGFFEVVVEDAREVELRYYTVDRDTGARRSSTANMTLDLFEQVATRLADSVCALTV